LRKPPSSGKKKLLYRFYAGMSKGSRYDSRKERNHSNEQVGKREKVLEKGGNLGFKEGV